MDGHGSVDLSTLTAVETTSVCRTAESGNPTASMLARTTSVRNGDGPMPATDSSTESGKVAMYRTHTGRNRRRLIGTTTGFQTASYNVSVSSVRNTTNAANSPNRITPAARGGATSRRTRGRCRSLVRDWRPQASPPARRNRTNRLAATFATPLGVGVKHSGPQYFPPRKSRYVTG